MYNILHKYKRHLFLIFKWIIVLCAFYFIYKKLNSNQLLSLSKLTEQFTLAFSTNAWTFIGILLLTDLNWLLEIFKWKTLVSSIRKISFFEAFEQSLGSLTVSIITPNRIVEYGAKALYFEKENQMKVLGLNFIGNMSQLLSTIFFGCIGLIVVLVNFEIILPRLKVQNALIIIGFFILLYFFRRHISFLNFDKYLQRFSQFLKGIPKNIYLKSFGFSITRFIVFSHQFYFLLLLFGAETDYFTLISLIFSIYFISSFIPSLTIFEWLIKGSVALWLFGFADLNELTVITVTTFMWILNFAIPAVFGSFFVINFKTSRHE